MRSFFGKAAAFAVLCVFLQPALPQTAAQSPPAQYPGRPIHVLLGIAPGGAIDTLTRIVAAKMQENWGRPVMVENKPGFSAVLATELVKKSAPDGYTLIVNGTAAMTINALAIPNLPYDPERDFVPIANIVNFPMFLAVHPSVPANSLKELIAYARANPGKLNYSAGTSFFQLATEMFKQMTGTDIRYVPYKGAGPQVQAAVAGEVQVSICDGAATLAFVRAGKLRALGVTTAKRVDAMPELPTIAEAGVPGYQTFGWIGMFAPAGTPKEIVAKLNSEVVRIVGLAEVRQKFAALGLEPASSTVEQLGNMVRNDIVRYGPIVKAANIKP